MFSQLPGTRLKVTFNTNYPLQKLFSPVLTQASSPSQAQPDVHGKPETHHWKPQALRLDQNLSCCLGQTHLCWTTTFPRYHCCSQKHKSGCSKRHKFSPSTPPANPRPHDPAPARRGPSRGSPRPPVAGASAVWCVLRGLRDAKLARY